MPVDQTREDLTDLAACREGAVDDYFFPPDYEDRPSGVHRSKWHGTYISLVNESELIAKVRYCDECPVRLACLASSKDAEYGVFGGFSAPERAMMRAGTWVPEPREGAHEAKTRGQRERIVRLVKRGLTPSEVAIKEEISLTTVNKHLRAYLRARHGA